jgi:excisionase family DNA binding protein
MTSEDWIELAEAAQLLKIHPSTLRRWADTGKIPYIRTLSGRRRFNRSAIQAAYKETLQDHSDEEVEQLEIKTLDLTRKRASSMNTGEEAWLSNLHLNEEQRLLFRYSGQRLLGLMMQFISRGDSAEMFLAEGRRVAGDYGHICFRAGLTISQTAEAFLFFRRSILESVQTTAGLGGPNDQHGHRIILRTIDFFDAMLVATIESYAQLKNTG